jgi:hypothetical protein
MKLKEIPFESLKGKIIKDIKINEENNEILFIDSDGQRYLMWHDQTCCERVTIEDICGDFDDLLNNPILIAEEASSDIKDVEDGNEQWTFYMLATIKGSVTIRWYGGSHGNYSISVDFGVQVNGNCDKNTYTIYGGDTTFVDDDRCWLEDRIDISSSS